MATGIRMMSDEHSEQIAENARQRRQANKEYWERRHERKRLVFWHKIQILKLQLEARLDINERLQRLADRAREWNRKRKRHPENGKAMQARLEKRLEAMVSKYIDVYGEEP